MQPPQVDYDRLNAIIEKNKGEQWGLIPLLQEVQEAFGYIPPDSIEPIADAMRMFPSQVQGVITFYAGFTLKPKGKYILKVCRGTACHVKGSRSIINMMQKELGLKDLKFDFYEAPVDVKLGDKLKAASAGGSQCMLLPHEIFSILAQAGALATVFGNLEHHARIWKSNLKHNSSWLQDHSISNVCEWLGRP